MKKKMELSKKQKGTNYYFHLACLGALTSTAVIAAIAVITFTAKSAPILTASAVAASATVVAPAAIGVITCLTLLVGTLCLLPLLCCRSVGTLITTNAPRYPRFIDNLHGHDYYPNYGNNTQTYIHNPHANTMHGHATTTHGRTNATHGPTNTTHGHTNTTHGHTDTNTHGHRP